MLWIAESHKIASIRLSVPHLLSSETRDSLLPVPLRQKHWVRDQSLSFRGRSFSPQSHHSRDMRHKSRWSWLSSWLLHRLSSAKHPESTLGRKGLWWRSDSSNGWVVFYILPLPILELILNLCNIWLLCLYLIWFWIRIRL